MEIKIYSTPTCPYCKMTKQYLSSKGFSYQDFNITEDSSAQEEMVRISGQMGVPVIDVDGKIIVGFDKPRIDSLLVK